MLERAFQRASVTGEWYIPGQRPRGFLSGLLGGGSKGEAMVGRIAMEGEEREGEGGMVMVIGLELLWLWRWRSASASAGAEEEEETEEKEEVRLLSLFL